MGPTEKEIKVSALQRLVKDRKYYVKELEEQRGAVAAMEEKIRQEALGPESDEAYELKNLRRIVGESEKLIPGLTAKAAAVLKDIEESFETLDESTREAVRKARAEIS